MIGVVCKHAAYGAADNIVRAFRSQGIEAELLYLCRDKYGRTSHDKLGCYLNKSNLDHWLSLLRLFLRLHCLNLANTNLKSYLRLGMT